ncbi:MAG: TRCF domain-containing protein [Verrucomicrobiota bacterium]
MMTVGDARKRIHAIKQYTALGSGFKIAMRDLEIRGAGNLLGTKQSGHIAQIGFDLYCQLLRQSVERLKCRQDSQRPATTFKADFIITSEAVWNAASTPPTSSPPTKKPKPSAHPSSSLFPPTPASHPLPAFIPAAWLSDTSLRISAYRDLADATNESAVQCLETAWRDRFGRLPEPAVRLLEIARIKAQAAALGIASVEIQGQRLMLHRNGEYVLLDGRRFPRLQSSSTKDKLPEAISLLKNF